MTRTPYPYQAETVDTVWRLYDEGKRAPLVVLPTGTGKTFTSKLIIDRARDRLGRMPRVAFWAHRTELVDQTIALYAESYGEENVGRIQAGGCQFGRPVSVGMIQTASQKRRLARLRAAEWDLCFVDEAHHSAAATYRRVIAALCGRETTLVGLTATPNRTDGVGLGEVYDHIHSGISLVEAIVGGFLVEPFGIRQVIDVNLDEVTTRNGDFAEAPLAERLNTPSARAAAVKAWIEHGEQRKTIAFGVRVDHAKALAEGFRAAGVAAAHVDGGMKAHERRVLYDDLASGALQVLVNVGVLTEGFDETSVSCVMLVRPTQSLGLYTQMIGRGLRKHAGKTDCLILDVTGTSRRKSLITLAMLGGLPAEPLEDDEPEPQDLEETRAKVVRRTDSVERTAGLLAVVREAERFDLLRIPRGRRYRWTQNARGLSLWLGSPSAGLFLVRPERTDPSRHRVIHVHQVPALPSSVDPSGGWRWDVRMEKLHALDAVGLCEQEAGRFNPPKGPVAVGPVDEELLETVIRDITARDGEAQATGAGPQGWTPAPRPAWLGVGAGSHSQTRPQSGGGRG